MAWPWAVVREQSPARDRSRPWAGGKGRNGSRGDVHGEDQARLSARPSPGAAAHTAVEPASTTVGLGHPEAEARWCFWGKRRRPHSGHPWGLGSGGSDLPASRGPRPAETHAARCPCLPHRLSTWRATRSTRSPPPWSRGGKVTGGWAHGGRATPGRGGAALRCHLTPPCVYSMPCDLDKHTPTPHPRALVFLSVAPVASHSRSCASVALVGPVPGTASGRKVAAPG